MVHHAQRSTGAPAAPVAPFLYRAEPGPGLHVAFTSVDAGNLAFHVSGTPADAHGGPQAPADAGDGPDPSAPRGRVAEARRRLEDAMGVAPGRTEYLTQVHSARVVPARGRGWDDPAAGEPEEADAVVSRHGRDPLAVMVADCLPVVFASRTASGAGAAGGQGVLDGPTAVAHAGRRGLLDGILEATVDRLRSAGASTAPGGIEAWIGPGICGACYEVPEQMRLEGAAQIPATASTTSWGTPALDLPSGAESVLGALGVTVHRVRVCTLEDGRLFSHRREPGRGRFTGLVWRTDADDAGEARHG
jgi:polyphenol oxidase